MARVSALNICRHLTPRAPLVIVLSRRRCRLAKELGVLFVLKKCECLTTCSACSSLRVLKRLTRCWEIGKQQGRLQGWQYFGAQSRSMDMNIETSSTFPTDNSLGPTPSVERPRQQMRVKVPRSFVLCAKLLESPPNHSWLLSRPL
jgi:hypothetical protein